MSWTRKAALLGLVILLIPGCAKAQDPALIYPGHPDFNAALFEPFEAEYEQMGAPFVVAFRKTEAERPVFSLLMIMGTESVGVDHVGHYADDFRFAYRKFGFGRYRNEYIHAEASGDTLRVLRMPLGAQADGEMMRVEKPLATPVFDGTAAYWLLGALPLEQGYTWKMHIWWPTEDGFDEVDTSTFEVVGREVIKTPDKEYNCWVVTLFASSGDAGVKMYVTDEAPYLIRQVSLQGGEEVGTIVDLKRLR